MIPDMTKSKKRPLSQLDKENASRLKEIWESKKKDLGLTQAKAADLMGFESQGAVSHYLNGITALNVSAILKFSSLLHIEPSEISTSFDYGHHATPSESGTIPKRSVDIMDAPRVVAPGPAGIDPFRTPIRAQHLILDITKAANSGLLDDDAIAAIETIFKAVCPKQNQVKRRCA